jgi:uncharacterized protein (TIGR02996 family)
MDLLSQHEAFLRAIFDSPDDDTPRLVYADFLQEHGEPERAELIRVQCRLASIQRRSEPVEVGESRKRERELLDKLHPELELIHWTPEEQARIGHERGFLIEPTAVICPGELEDVAGVREKIVRTRPHWFGVQRLAVQPGWFLYPEHVEVLFNLVGLRQVNQWNLSGDVEDGMQPVIAIPGIRTLGRHPGAERITFLNLTNNNLDHDAARALIESPYLLNLKGLELGAGNNLGGIWPQLVERFGEDVVE